MGQLLKRCRSAGCRRDRAKASLLEYHSWGSDLSSLGVFQCGEAEVEVQVCRRNHRGDGRVGLTFYDCVCEKRDKEEEEKILGR